MWRHALFCLALVAVYSYDPRPAAALQEQARPDFVKRLKGRILGCFIWNGMPSKQVKWILGQPDGGSANLVGGVIIGDWKYDDLGLKITLYSDDNHPVYHVVGVTYQRLF